MKELDIMRAHEDSSVHTELFNLVANAIGETKHRDGAVIKSARIESMIHSPFTVSFTRKANLLKLANVVWLHGEDNSRLPTKLVVKQYIDDTTRISLENSQQLPSRYVIEKVTSEIAYTKGHYNDKDENRICAVPEPFPGTKAKEALDKHKILIKEYISGMPLGLEIDGIESILKTATSKDEGFIDMRNRLEGLVKSALSTLALFHVATTEYKEDIYKEVSSYKQKLIEVNAGIYKKMMVHSLRNVFEHKGIKLSKKEEISLDHAVSILSQSTIKDCSEHNSTSIIHGDSHLNNFISGDKGVKLLDLGHAKIGLPHQDVAYTIITSAKTVPIHDIRMYTDSYIKERNMICQNMRLESKLQDIGRQRINEESFIKDVLLFSLGGIIKIAGNNAYCLSNLTTRTHLHLKQEYPHEIESNIQKWNDITRLLTKYPIQREVLDSISSISDILYETKADDRKEPHNRQSLLSKAL